MRSSNVVVASAAFWVNFCLLGVLRSNAVIFRALVNEYDVERQGAAWPSGIFGFCMCLTGALSGFLTYYISLKNLAMLGVVLASIAVSGSSLASNLNQIVYLYGALQGVGVGMVVPLTHVVLNQHFSRYRAFALGIAYSGSSAGSFLFPPLTQTLMQQYGLPGTFLLLGGVMLNALIGAMLFRAPPRAHKASPKCQEKAVQTTLVVCQTDHSIKKGNPDENCCQIREYECTSKPPNASQQVVLKNNFGQKLASTSLMAGEILLNPHFLIVSAAYAVYFSTSAIYLMVILDFAHDRGVAMQEGVFLVSAFSFGDCAGRLSFGWIADAQGLMPRTVLVRFYLVAMGLLMGLMPLCSARWFAAFAVALGLLNGSVIVNHSVLLNEYLGIEKLPIAVGFSMFAIGMTAMLRPVVIGVFRDRHSSYDHLFMFIGFLQVLVTAVWFIGSLALTLRKHRRLHNSKSVN